MEVVQFPPRCGEIPAMLRKLADDIEAGKEYGIVLGAAVVINGNKPYVFGYGEAELPNAHYLLCTGARILEAPMVEKARGS